MTSRSRVCAWILLPFCALLVDTQAFCADDCPATVTLTTTDTSFEFRDNCSISTEGRNSTNGLIDGLTSGKTHQVQVHCRECCKLATTKPGPVQNLNATVTTSSIFVSWTAPVGESASYMISWTHKDERMMVNTTKTSKNITNLTAGTQYVVSVTAVAKDTETTGNVSTLHQYTKPNMVENLSVNGKTTSSVYLSWTQPGGRNSFYRVKWENGLNHGSHSVKETNLNVSNLTPGERYTFIVRSVAGDDRTESEMREISSYTRPEAVLNLNITEITTSSVYLSWTQPGGRNSFYRVKWENGLNHGSHSVKETNLNVSNLTPGERYTFIVQSVAGDDRTESEMREISSYTKPEKPANLMAAHQGTDSLSITWTLSGEKTYFNVVLKNNDLMYQNTKQTSSSSAAFTDLHPGRIYKVNVTAVAGHLTATSDTFTFATVPTPPGPISVANRTNSSLLLVWAGPHSMGGAPNITYEITYQHDGGERQGKDTVENRMELSSLSSGTAYFIQIKTIGPQNLGSTPVNISTFTLPNPVLDLKAGPESTTSVTVFWSDPVGVRPDYTYLVEVSDVTGAFMKVKTVSNNRALVSELEPGSKYIIGVKTVAAPGSSSTVEQTSSYTMPTAVKDLTVAHVNATSIRLQWLRQDDHQPSFTYLVQAFQEDVMVHNGSTQNVAYTLDSLTPGTLYTLQVFAVVEGVKSEAASVENYTQPEAVSHMNVSGTTTALSVSWELASGQVSSYCVQLHREQQHVKSSNDLSNRTTRFEFSYLKPGVDYCVVLVTKSGPHETSSSRVCNATFPNPPGPVRVQSQTVRSINFTWTSPVDMAPGHQTSFIVTTVRGSIPTRDNWYLLDGLQSGSPYNISVVTVGVRGYRSTEVTAQNYTRPHPVTDLRATQITTDTVTLEWTQQEAKRHYSYLVQVPNKTTDNPRRVWSQNITVELQSGTNFSFIVTTLTADRTEADPVTVSYVTRPLPVNDLVAEALNTTTVLLKWRKPLEYKMYYRYGVEVAGFPTINTMEESVKISELLPGTNWTFCVHVEAAGMKGETMCTSEYTKPETVEPTLSSQSNDSVQVSWTKPLGIVEKYQVTLSRSLGDSKGSMLLVSAELKGNSTGHLFQKLSAGRLYSTVVVAHSGPFSATSESKENATFPNPPGPITILTKTTRSLSFQWTEAPLMEGAEFFYQLTLTQPPGGNTTHITTNTTSITFDSLPSGTSFTVSVSTLGIRNFESQKVCEMATTRPLSVPPLNTTAGVTWVQVDWMNPHDYKDSYHYNLTWGGPDASSAIVRNNSHTLDDLVPGSRYNISVTTETSDGTRAEPRWSFSCTRASPAPNLTCKSPNEDDARIILSWLTPRGHNSGFRVLVNDGEVNQTGACCAHNISNLRHNTEYNIVVKTLSCGEASVPETLQCTTGITNPALPSDYQLKVATVVEGHNKFSVKIDPTLFDPVKGPITHVGVLVTTSLSGECTGCRKYLEKTYHEFTDGTAAVYLATVTGVRESRSGQEVSIDIGNNGKWEGYSNGALEAKTTYRYAIALFSSLTLQQDLVDGTNSLVSFTGFTFVADLPVDPAVIGIAVGSTLGIFCVLFIILIGFIIFWRRMSKQESPEIQIQNLRAKVSAPVRVEEYEAYFKKQKANSNCGFAEEFEDLKPVGTAQAKIQALSVENKSKNRYTNVLPYDSSRVKLSIIRGSPSDDYINANYMPGYNSRKEFIAAQGPLSATVNDFWRMIWEKNVQTLVMLTRCNEQGRVKCEQYWSPGTKHFENITVTTASEIPLDDWTIRDFTIKNVKTAETRSVRHFHFTAWPDHGVPESTELLISFRHLVREHMNQFSRHCPTMVHCSAGVGRTGTFIAIDHLIFQIERENMVDVFGIVHELRMHRALMVQTEDQYVFLNQCALDLIRSRTGTNVDLIYQNAAAFSIYENLEPHRGFSKKNRQQKT